MVGIYLFPDDLIKRRTINPLFLSGAFPEIPRIAQQIVQNEEVIKRVKQHSIRDDTNDCLAVDVITLCDVFKIVKKDEFPNLWNVVKKCSQCCRRQSVASSVSVA